MARPAVIPDWDQPDTALIERGSADPLQSPSVAPPATACRGDGPRRTSRSSTRPPAGFVWRHEEESSHVSRSPRRVFASVVSLPFMSCCWPRWSWPQEPVPHVHRRSTAASAETSPITAAACCPGVTVTITSIERKTVDTVVTNESGNYSKNGCSRAHTKSRSSSRDSRRPSCPPYQVSVDTQTPLDFKLELGAMTETVEVDGRSPRSQDRPRRRVARRSITKQLTELPVSIGTSPSSSSLTPGHTAARVAACGDARTRRAPRRFR